MKHETHFPVRFTPPAAPENRNPGPMDPWHGPGLHPAEINPAASAAPGRHACFCTAARDWLEDWYEDLTTFLVLFMGAYLILMLIAAAERRDLLAGWL